MEFPVLHYTGVLKRWKKKTLQLVEEGCKLIDGTFPNNKANNIIYFLRNAVVLDNIKNDKLMEISLRSGRLYIQAFSLKEKQIIKEKLRKHILKINESNCFSREFEDYINEINKIDEENPSDDIFKNIQSYISLLINFFLELNQKLDDFKTIIDSPKLGNIFKSNFSDCYNKMIFIESKMKEKFDELVKTLYDYHDLMEPKVSGKLVQENFSKFDNGLGLKKCSSISTKSISHLELDTSDSESEKPEEEKKIVLFKEDPFYNFEKRTKLDKKIQLNKNMIPEIVKLITSGQKVLPIQFNEPLNTLQRECEKFKFCDLLNKAADAPNPEMKMAYIAAFVTADMSMSIGRVLKPMIPLVGETFEYVDNDLKYRYFAEEVQRKPSHISAYMVEGEKWKLWGDNRNSASFKFFSGAYGVDFENKTHLELLNMNKKGNNQFDIFLFNRPSTLLKGIFLNKLHYDYNGKINISSPDYPNINCTVEYLSDSEEGNFVGKVFKEEEKIIYKIGGNWKKNFYITDPDDNNKNILFTVQEEDFFKNSVESYIIPAYSCNLNYINDKLKQVLPISDTRYRPDQKEYEIGSTEKSQEIKKLIEGMQIYKQNKLDKNKEEYQPIYFANDYNETSKDFVYIYKGGYWEDRNNKKFKVKDIFNTKDYEKEMSKVNEVK